MPKFIERKIISFVVFMLKKTRIPIINIPITKGKTEYKRMFSKLISKPIENPVRLGKPANSKRNNETIARKVIKIFLTILMFII